MSVLPEVAQTSPPFDLPLEVGGSKFAIDFRYVVVQAHSDRNAISDAHSREHLVDCYCPTSRENYPILIVVVVVIVERCRLGVGERIALVFPWRIGRNLEGPGAGDRSLPIPLEQHGGCWDASPPDREVLGSPRCEHELELTHIRSKISRFHDTPPFRDNENRLLMAERNFPGALNLKRKRAKPPKLAPRRHIGFPGLDDGHADLPKLEYHAFVTLSPSGLRQKAFLTTVWVLLGKWLGAVMISRSILSKAANRFRGGKLVLGAVVGSGLTARAAERGGADFLVAQNTGRLRMMGVASIAGQLALRENNSFVFGFSREEILGHIGIPVFFGYSVLNPRLDLDQLVDEVKRAGFDGVANARTISRLSPCVRHQIESVGLGLEREASFMTKAARLGLMTLALVSGAADVPPFEACADIFCVQLGRNSGEFGIPRVVLSMEDAAGRSESIIRAARRNAPKMICLLSGSPIVQPGEMFKLCDTVGANGYVGGSTLERLPVERSIEEQTAAFKSVNEFNRRTKLRESRVLNLERRHKFIARSPHMAELVQRAVPLAAGLEPLLVCGEAGSGKTYFAHLINEIGLRFRGRSESISIRRLEDSPDIVLFGRAADAEAGVSRRKIGWLEMMAGGTLVVEDIEALDFETQLLLADAIETRHFRPVGANASMMLEAKLIFLSRMPMQGLTTSGALINSLYQVLAPNVFDIPTLRERLDDIPALAQSILSDIWNGTGGQKLDNSALRALRRYDWPGNIRELKSVLVEAGRNATLRISSKDIDAVLSRRQNLSLPTRIQSEREWVIDALRRYRYRRGEAAEYLGISRKTLYNKIKKLGIM